MCVVHNRYWGLDLVHGLHIGAMRSKRNLGDDAVLTEFPILRKIASDGMYEEVNYVVKTCKSERRIRTGEGKRRIGKSICCT